jgi:DNA-binding PadR family transcriptional regulator
MAKGEYLGEFEQLVLWALVRLGAEAYGMRVRKEIEARTSRDVSIGAVYATLERLLDKGLVTSTLGEASAVRGGRAKRHFHVTSAGAQALRESQRALTNMWQDVAPEASR